MISISGRQERITLINEARQSGARLKKACEVLKLSPRTFQRWTREGGVIEDKRPTALRPVPANKLSELECHKILDICHESQYSSLPPGQIVPALADRGIYLGAEATFYRILRKAMEQTHRGRARKPRKQGLPRSHKGERPNQIWSWDITWLRSLVKGKYFYLYLILDIYSRKIVGWEIHEKEASELSAALVYRAVLAEKAIDQLEVLHADNGSAQKGSTLLAKLEALNVAPSYSRPRVSNDNAHAEAIFKTCKYRPNYQKEGFENLEEARKWVEEFVSWYNFKHLHSGIRFVTPASRHNGEDTSILARRDEVYQAAREKHPERWSGKTRNWTPVKEVWLNKPTDEKLSNSAVAQAKLSVAA